MEDLQLSKNILYPLRFGFQHRCRLKDAEDAVKKIYHKYFLLVVWFFIVFAPICPGSAGNEIDEREGKPDELLAEDDDSEEIPFSEITKKQAQEFAKIEPSILLRNENEIITIAQPSAEELEQILAAAYNSSDEIQKEMKQFIVGISGQDHLMTLADAYREKWISETGAGAVIQRVHGFREGEIATLKLKFGLRSGEDMVIGRFPASMIAHFPGDEAVHPGDPAIAPLMKWLEIMSHMTWVTPLGVGSGGVASLSTATSLSYDNRYNRQIVGVLYNYFQPSQMQSIFGGGFFSPVGTGGSVGVNNGQSSHSLWTSMMWGWASLGYSGLYNLEENQLGLSAIGGGGFIGGWKNFATLGISLSLLMDNGNQLGIGGYVSLLKDRITSYLHRYEGQYDKLLDGFIEEYKKISRTILDELVVTERLISLHSRVHNSQRLERMQLDKKALEKEFERSLAEIWRYKQEKDFLAGKHFIEVVDTQNKGFRINGGFYVNGVGMGLRYGTAAGSESIHRFYTPLSRANQLLHDGNGERFGLLRIPEVFDTEQFPDILKPHLWKIGEEVITTVSNTYNGSIVMGIFGIPGFDAKVGLSGTINGSFEIGLRKLPGNKLEVSFCPTKIKEMGAFVSAISTIAELSLAASVAVALRQTFVFDLNNQKAIDTYMLFMTGGVLPLDFSATANINGPIEAENLLDIAIIARKNLSAKGILLTYLEKIDVPAKKFHLAFARFPLISSRTWAGLSYEYLKGSAKMVSTNAEFAVSRTTCHSQSSFGYGVRGTRRQGAYATIRRVFVKANASDDSNATGQAENNSLSDGYTWRFKGITLQARLEADKIVGGAHNEMIEKINTMFQATINRFPPDSSGHQQSRDILLERELSGKDLDKFAKVKQRLIEQVANSSGVKHEQIAKLLAKLEDRGHNEMANIIKDFVEENGFNGVSAIHLLLEGSCRNLVIRTESSSYSAPVKRAIALEAAHTTVVSDQLETRKITLSGTSTKKEINAYFSQINENIEEVDLGLKDLWEDPFLEGQDDLLKFEDGKLREKKSTIRSKLLAAKARLLDLLDLEKQGLTAGVIETIFAAIDKEKRTSDQRYVLLAAKYRRPISMHDSRDEIAKRWEKTQAFLTLLKSELAALDTQQQRKILGQLFVHRRLRRLNELKLKAEDLLALKHLEGYAQKFVEKMTQGRFFSALVKPLHSEIAGQMQAVHNDQVRLHLEAPSSSLSGG